MSAYVDSFYSRTRRPTAPRAALHGSVAVDVAIVGGGLAGLTAAIEIARAGRSVAVIEAERIGWGASGRNGGFVGPGYATSLSHIALMAGRDAAHELYRLSIEGVRIVEENLAALGPTDNVATYGKLSVLRYSDAPALLVRQEMMARDFGYALEFRDRAQVRGMLRSKKYYEALFDPQAFHFHPLNYAVDLAAGIEALGGRIFEGAPVVACDLDGATKVLRTPGGEVRARDVVFATGGYTGSVTPQLRGAMLPIATYVLVTEVAPQRIAEVIGVPYAISDNRRAGDYYRLVDGGRRLLWGGRITTRTSEPARLAEQLRATMVSTYPELAGIGIDAAWSGLMSYARHLMPMIGQAKPNVWHCFGFGGHGLNTTAIGGRVVAEGILGTSDRYRLYAPFGVNWAGGPFGVAAAQMTYWTYQAMDFVREFRSARAG
ncbi:FAD-binding oxidoreductase [uncultured Alsobacter sp.]|uniref:NAD(P)/FAD-dependent oxidoreductase n=1 Tax=uncultured Alsobacter sp. TaxID=1748258 RepID=UPI0025DF8E8E|nr:FAD-binding oxidoreductase [uncultured Alsobacter sp.]